MILRSVFDTSPRAASTARAADNAALIGDVELGPFVSVWYGAVLRGDAAPIRVGDGTNVQDNCVIHSSADQPTIIGRSVTIGHGAILHSCTVEDGVLIGMGAILLDGCRIGAGSVIGAGALISPGTNIPPRSLVVGVPGRVVRTVSLDEATDALSNTEHYVDLARAQLLPIPAQES